MGLLECNFDTCEATSSLYGYRPDLAPNAFFLAIISLCLAGSIGVFAKTLRRPGFSFLLTVTLVFEIVAYSERVNGWKNPWNLTDFIIGVVCSTIGPAFLSMGMHLCVGEIAVVLGEEHFVLTPRLHARLFIAADVVAGFVQGAGLALTFVDSNLEQLGSLVGSGRYVVMAGLIIQVALLAGSLALLAWMYIRAASANRKYGYTTFRSDFGYVALPSRSKVFLVAFPLAGACLLLRCLYRVYFFYDGIQGSFAQNQLYYVAAEGILVTEALVAFVVFHPSLWLINGLDRLKNQAKGEGRQKSEAHESMEEVSQLIQSHFKNGLSDSEV